MTVKQSGMDDKVREEGGEGGCCCSILPTATLLNPFGTFTLKVLIYFSMVILPAWMTVTVVNLFLQIRRKPQEARCVLSIHF